MATRTRFNVGEQVKARRYKARHQRVSGNVVKYFRDGTALIEDGDKQFTVITCSMFRPLAR